MAFGDRVQGGIYTGTGDITATFGATAFEGNLLVIAVTEDGGGDDVPATPSGWTMLEQDAAAPTDLRFDIYYKISDGTETAVTVAYGGSNITSLVFNEFVFDNTQDPQPLDSVNKTDTTAATLQAGAVTPSGTPNICVAIGIVTDGSAAGPYVISDSYTIHNGITHAFAGSAMASKTSQAGSQNPTWTPDTAVISDAYFAVFHGAGATPEVFGTIIDLEYNRN